MGLPRSHYVREGEEGVYHCFSRCVRRAFLCGYDAVTGRDFSHRKAWLLDRMKELAGIFAIEVCAYAILAAHYHLIARTRPDIVALWTDREVARRWLMLFPARGRGKGVLPEETDISGLADQPERIAELRQRLSSLSWFMGQLNEYIARAANKEDGVKGRFWESRFKAQVLLDEAGVAACMVYVDLNAIRAGLAETPEGSDFTSIQERIQAWQRERSAGAADSRKATEAEGRSTGEPAAAERLAVWLCPIQSDLGRRGILPMRVEEYMDLVDRSGRLIRTDKRGAIDAGIAPILQRLGAEAGAWQETITDFGSSFCLAAGLLCSLRRFAQEIGRHWIKGVGKARTAFLSSLPQWAGC
jgi:hypothetical protein